MRIRSLLAVLLVVLLTPPAALAAASSTGWRLVTTPHFRVYSQLGERQTATWIRDYDQFISATSETLGIAARQLPPLTVVLFARDKTYTDYKLMRPNGRAAKVAGQFSRSTTWSVIGLAMDSDDEATRQTIFHEGTHWLMSGDPGRQPAWFSEGIAEMLSTFDHKGDKVSWAKPIGGHLSLFRDYRPMPMLQFLTQTEALSDQENHTDLFYAQSWAFVHFLTMSSDPARRQQLVKFLGVFKESSGEAAVRETFGEDLTPLEKQFAAYTRELRFGYITRPAKAAAEPPVSVAAPPAAVEAALALLALGAERLPLARQHADRAVTLAPEQPAGHELLAYLADAAKDPDAVSRHAAAAVKTGSKDAEMYVLMAQSLPDSSEATQSRVSLLEQALQLRPHPDMFRLLSEALLNHAEPDAQDRRYLEAGVAAFPGNDWLKVGHAALIYRQGEQDAALDSMRQALRPASTLEPRQRDYATQLRRTWVMNAINEHMANARQSADFVAARALIAKHREDVEDGELAAALDRFSEQVISRDLFARLEEALRERRTADVSALTQQLLARPDLPAELRTMLERMPRTGR